MTQNDQHQEPPHTHVRGIKLIRRKLDDSAYMSEAVQRLAQELSIEIMENTYGIPFR